jgi:hypothetical protein
VFSKGDLSGKDLTLLGRGKNGRLGGRKFRLEESNAEVLRKVRKL